MTELKDCKRMKCQALKNEIKKHEELKSTASVLQQHMEHYYNQVMDLQKDIEGGARAVW